MANLTTIQEVLLEQIEHELKEVVYEHYQYGISESDYLREARSFVTFLFNRYKETR